MRTCAARSGLREGLADMSATTVIYAQPSAMGVGAQTLQTGADGGVCTSETGVDQPERPLLDARRRNVNFEIRSPVLLTTAEAGKTGSGDTEGDG